MAKTIFITGASSGIGKATALLFLERGWNVVATMRSPENADFAKSDQLCVLRLDVTDQQSITDAIEKAVDHFGGIDVVLNNAGYGLFDPLETVSHDRVQRQFDVNVLGVTRMTHAVLPHFRQKKAGRFINISSMGGLMTLPLGSVYHSTKYAVEGLSECLNYELNRLGIDVKLIEPGVIRTDFYDRSMDTKQCDIVDYHPVVQAAYATMQRSTHSRLNSSSPEKVARVIYRAATTGSRRMRYLVGFDARMLVWMRRLLGARLFMSLVKRVYRIT